MAKTYHSSGVDYSLMDPFKNACIAATNHSPEFIKYRDSYLVDIIEALGSLTKLADILYQQTGRNYYYQVAWSNAATILNDLSAFGAVPQTLKLFIATGSKSWFQDPLKWQQIIRGFADAAKYAGVGWNGGETQTLTDIIRPQNFVIAGSSFGIIEPISNLLDPQNLVAGDQIILFKSSGIHTNGITLIRKLFPKSPEILTRAIHPKTHIYTPLINDLLRAKVPLHYASHITGHGWRKIMRPRQDLTYQIHTIPKPQPIFRTIQTNSGMSDSQMYSDYNMGAGFALYAPSKSVPKILKTAQKHHFQAILSGQVIDGPRQVVIEPRGITLSGSSLSIR